MKCLKCNKEIENVPRFVDYLCEKCGEETRNNYDKCFLDVPLPQFIKKIAKKNKI